MFSSSPFYAKDKNEIPDDLYLLEKKIIGFVRPPKKSLENMFMIKNVYTELIKTEQKYLHDLHPRFFIIQGMFFEKMSNPQKAFAIYEKARTAFPTYFYAYAFPAIFFYKKVEYENCKNLLMKYVDIFQDHEKELSPRKKKYLAMTYILLAEVHALLGERVERKTALNYAKLMDPFFFTNGKDHFLYEALEIPIIYKKKPIADEHLLFITPGAMSEGLGELIRLSCGFFSQTISKISAAYLKKEDKSSAIAEPAIAKPMM